MKIKPLGFYVLVEMVEVESVSQGGIILNTQEVARDQEATSVGYVRAIGPTAFCGYPGCEAKEGGRKNVAEKIGEIKLEKQPDITPADCWGLEIGQKIEYRRYEGKTSAAEGYEKHRYIPDSHIIGAIEDE